MWFKGKLEEPWIPGRPARIPMDPHDKKIIGKHDVF